MISSPTVFDMLQRWSLAVTDQLDNLIFQKHPSKSEKVYRVEMLCVFACVWVCGVCVCV